MLLSRARASRGEARARYEDEAIRVNMVVASDVARRYHGRGIPAEDIDQVAYLGDRVFGKPGTESRAVAQLQQMSGQTVVFHTALALLNTRSGRLQTAGIPTRVRFRTLTEAEIRRYVAKEQPLDCAGSAKSEGLGISLLEALSGDDPTALIGLPLIALSRMLRAEGLELP